MEEILLKNRTLSGELIAEADEVDEVLLAELAGEDDFDTAFAKIAGFHDGFVFVFKIVSQTRIGANFQSITV